MIKLLTLMVSQELGKVNNRCKIGTGQRRSNLELNSASEELKNLVNTSATHLRTAEYFHLTKLASLNLHRPTTKAYQIKLLSYT